MILENRFAACNDQQSLWPISWCTFHQTHKSLHCHNLDREQKKSVHIYSTATYRQCSSLSNRIDSLFFGFVVRNCAKLIAWVEFLMAQFIFLYPLIRNHLWEINFVARFFFFSSLVCFIYAWVLFIMHLYSLVWKMRIDEHFKFVVAIHHVLFWKWQRDFQWCVIILFFLIIWPEWKWSTLIHGFAVDKILFLKHFSLFFLQLRMN